MRAQRQHLEKVREDYVVQGPASVAAEPKQEPETAEPMAEEDSMLGAVGEHQAALKDPGVKSAKWRPAYDQYRRITDGN